MLCTTRAKGRDKESSLPQQTRLVAVYELQDAVQYLPEAEESSGRLLCICAVEPRLEYEYLSFEILLIPQGSLHHPHQSAASSCIK